MQIANRGSSDSSVSAAQVALRWNLQRGHAVVPKSFDPDHILENTELFHFSLSPEDYLSDTCFFKHDECTVILIC